MFASQLWCTWPGCLWSKLDSGCLQESLRWSDPLLTALLAWTELFWNCPNNNFAAAKTSYSKICSGSSSLDSKACFPWKSYSYFQDLTFTLKCFSLNPSLQQTQSGTSAMSSEQNILQLNWFCGNEEVLKRKSMLRDGRNRSLVSIADCITMLSMDHSTASLQCSVKCNQCSSPLGLFTPVCRRMV